MRVLAIAVCLGALGGLAAGDQIVDQSWSDAGFAIEISGIRSAVWKEFIVEAQQVAAPNDLVADLPWPGGGCERLDLEGIAKGSRWWSYCDGPFPVAITVNQDVVRYYQTIIRRLAEPQPGDGRTAAYAKLEYRPRSAHASRYAIDSQVYHDVVVVRLPLRLKFGGDGCHTDIDMERVLVYDKDRQLLDITGDGIVTPATVCY